MPLPAELFAKLQSLKEPTYLWESYPQGLMEPVIKRGCPVHRVKPDFKPSRLYHWIETLFIEYGKENPDRPPIHSHQLRKGGVHGGVAEQYRPAEGGDRVRVQRGRRY